MLQDNTIANVNKEKKLIEEENRKLTEKLLTFTEKNNQLVRSKTKLERTIEDVEDLLDREKRHRIESEKMKKKFDVELHFINEQLDEFNKIKNNTANKQQRVDEELFTLFNQIDEQTNLTNVSQNKIRECLNNIVKLEEEIETEQHVLTKLDKTKKFIQNQLKSFNDFIDEANQKTIEQNELNKKKELEIFQQKQVFQTQNQCMENDLSNLRKKYLEETVNLNEQLNALQTATSKSEKEKEISKHMLDEILEQINDQIKTKIDKKRFFKQNENQISELQAKFNENNKYIQVII